MNEKIIWDYLLQKVKNPYGVAAIMGNLMAESSLNPVNATGKNKTSRYVDDADNGRIDFAHDGVAFGLVQWCYWSRKQGLLDFAKSKRKSVGDIYVQLDYMWNELQKYSTVLTAVLDAKDIRTASDIFMLKYEKPAGTGDAARQKRAAYGLKFYDTYAGKQPSPSPTPPVSGSYVFATKNVNIRTGNSMENEKVGVLPAGHQLQYLETKDGWHAVKLWVSGEFSKVSYG